MTEPQDTRQEIWLGALCGRQIAEHAFRGLPYEACGVLRGKAAAGGMRIDNFLPMRNVAPDPLHHFILHPEEWTKQCLRGEGLIGLFHSHPHSQPTPSDEDLRQLSLFAGLIRIYLIGSPDESKDAIRLNGYYVVKGADGLYTLEPALIKRG